MKENGPAQSLSFMLDSPQMDTDEHKFDDTRGEAHPLEYASPLPKAVRRQRARARIHGLAVLSASAFIALFGLPWLLFGLLGVAAIYRDIAGPPPHDLKEDIGLAIGCLLVGLFCGFMSWLGFRHGWRILREAAARFW